VRALAAALLVAAVATGGSARAHGGLPVSAGVLRAGDGTLYVPVVYWGLWVGPPGQPWSWICEEVVNGYRARQFALSTDGTFYVTDARGLQRSRDRGCSWTSVGGEPAERRITGVAVDPNDGATAFFVSGDSARVNGGAGPADLAEAPPDNALFVTRDHGDTFTRAPGLAAASGRVFSSVAIAPSEPRTLYVTSFTPRGMEPMVHVSGDGGGIFADLPLTARVDGVVPTGLAIIAVDPRDPTIVYARAQAVVPGAGGALTPRHALLRSIDGGVTFSTVMTIDAQTTSIGTQRGIDAVAIDAARGRVYVAARDGLYAGDDPGRAPTLTVAKSSSLSQAQCAAMHGDALYACANNFDPDRAAVARSDDGAQTFASILRFGDTSGVLECPADTPVARECPTYWRMYGAQLGVPMGDLGVGDGGVTPPGSGGCGCAVGGREVAGAGALVLALALLVLAARRRPMR
jgi:hypothetical protein